MIRAVVPPAEMKAALERAIAAGKEQADKDKATEENAATDDF